MQWHIKSFEALSTHELYSILKLRTEVFIIEQHCIYCDTDDKDCHPEAVHVFAKQEDNVVCYARLLPPGCSYPEKSSIGRVVIASSQRGQGLGHTLLQKAIKELQLRWPDATCHISAQIRLQTFYNSHGFVAVTDEYLEDDMPHIGMERACRAS